jgi:catechol 2,3-dioxygenase-like lactoylglutathione lyase family enzyme
LETAAVSTSTIPTALRRADHVCIGVDDFEGVLAWYCEKLGFAVEKRWHVEKLPGVQLAYLIGPVVPSRKIGPAGTRVPG